MNRPPRRHGTPESPAPEPARHLALAALARVHHGAFLAPTLDELLNGSGLAREDRALVTDLAYGALRRLPQLDAALAPLLTRPGRLPPATLDALRLGTFEVLHRGTPRYAAVSAWVDVVKAAEPRLAGLVNAVLRRVGPADVSADPALAAALPGWLFARIAAGLGSRAAGAAAAMLEPEPLWLTALGEGAEEVLAADGATVSPLAWPGAGPVRPLRVRSPVPVAQLTAFRRGLVQPQNPASLAVALALGAGPGDRVLDLASGRGVKTAVLAAVGADVTAVELDERRSAAASANLARLGLRATHVTGDLLRPLPLPSAPLVLLDAPCTGTGTLRGHPEIKLRLTEEDVAAAARAQARMLATAATVTAPGGAVLYAVCSLTPDEGPDVVAAFLAGAPGFQAVRVELPLPSADVGPGSFILPEDGADGFFVARLRRAEA